MAEALSFTASTIAIVTLAYKSTKSFIDFIEALKDAPQMISDLKGDVSAVQNVIKLLENLIERSEVNTIPDEIRLCLSSAKVPLKDCETVIRAFQSKLIDWFHNSKWSMINASLKEAKIQKFRMRMKDTQETLHLALTVCSLKVDGIRAVEVKGIEENMQRQLHVFTGKLEGLEAGRQEVLDAAQNLSEQSHQLSSQQNDFVDRIAGHEILLREALKFCTAGLLATGKKTGKFAQMVKVTERARAIVAVVSQVTGDVSGGIEIGELIAEGDSRAVGITDDADFALKFLE
ncbi:hypothetical protein BS50DRAFT_681332 [Corynespora cassiicola Philippines]|uniref:Azaphilone pigments biosynthesis cluster protein L N-terminal domain-containing protein n=1 Tax=Corynespora cassiicola Philippines TaxID=1448308 RepID=A0A2T2N5R5_CORCC|nr:hypothetical protein BS50DRAFT_681332 [Corynespora cassiicola Philippines]